MTIYLTTSLENLMDAGLLTEQALAALYLRGTKTVGELMEQRERGRLNRYNFSVGTLSDIEDFLDKLDSGDVVIGKSDSPKDDGAERKPSANLALKKVIKVQEALLFNQIYMFIAYESIARLNGAVAQLVRQLFPDAKTMGEAILNKEYDVLTVHRDLGRTGNIELRRFLLHYLKVVELYSRKARIIDERPSDVAGELINRLSSNIYKFDNEVVIYDFLSALQRRELFRLYDTLSEGLSPAAREFQRMSLPGLTDAMKLFGLPEPLLAEKYSFMSDRTVLHEVWNMVQELENAVSDELYSDKEVKLKARVSSSFPWLSAAEQRFVFRFHLDNGYMPLFYIMLQFLRNSLHKDVEIYSLVNGVQDGLTHTPKDVATERAITHSRVLQMIKSGLGFSKATIERYIGWGDYASLLDSNYVTAMSPKYRKIQAEEKLPGNFGVFCALLSVLGDFEVMRIGQETVAVHKRIRPFVYVYYIETRLRQVRRNRQSNNILSDLRSIVADVPEDVREDVFRIVCLVAAARAHIHFDEDWMAAVRRGD